MLFTLDLETSVDCAVEGQMKASPHHVGNNVVLAGWKSGDKDVGTGTAEDLRMELIDWLYSDQTPIVLCGFNIGFDLAYLLRDKEFSAVISRFLPQMRVWDVQQAQYLISGQTLTYPSLDATSELYGLPVKPDKIKGYWDAGMRTEDIPLDELTEYLIHDVSTTAELARKQVALMSKEMRDLCFIKGDDILCTTLMESVGMNFDLDMCGNISDDVRQEVVKAHDKLHWLVRSVSGYEHFQPTKLREVQTVLYGGTFKWDEQEEAGLFKTGLKKGQKKYKKVVREKTFDGILSPVTMAKAKEKFDTSVDDKALQWICDNEDPRNIDVGIFLAELMTFREYHKDVSTYYDGYSRLTWDDGKIRPSFQHCSTRTGRLSCTKPNLQNVSKE